MQNYKMVGITVYWLQFWFYSTEIKQMFKHLIHFWDRDFRVEIPLQQAQ